MSFLNLDWLNASADVYVCENFGFVHCFLGGVMLFDSHEEEEAAVSPEQPPEDDTSSPSECLRAAKPCLPASIVARSVVGPIDCDIEVLTA